VLVRQLAKFVGHANTAATEHIYTHLFDTDDHSGATSVLGAVEQTKLESGVPFGVKFGGGGGVTGSRRF
jgi:hypothetical protein